MLRKVRSIESFRQQFNNYSKASILSLASATLIASCNRTSNIGSKPAEEIGHQTTGTDDHGLYLKNSKTTPALTTVPKKTTGLSKGVNSTESENTGKFSKAEPRVSHPTNIKTSSLSKVHSVPTDTPTGDNADSSIHTNNSLKPVVVPVKPSNSSTGNGPNTINKTTTSTTSKVIEPTGTKITKSISSEKKIGDTTITKSTSTTEKLIPAPKTVEQQLKEKDTCTVPKNNTCENNKLLNQPIITEDGKKTAIDQNLSRSETHHTSSHSNCELTTNYGQSKIIVTPPVENKEEESEDDWLLDEFSSDGEENEGDNSVNIDQKNIEKNIEIFEKTYSGVTKNIIKEFVESENLETSIINNYEQIAKEMLDYYNDENSNSSKTILVNASIKTRRNGHEYNDSRKYVARVTLQKDYKVEVHANDKEANQSLFYLETLNCDIVKYDEKTKEFRWSENPKAKLRLNLPNSYKEEIEKINTARVKKDALIAKNITILEKVYKDLEKTSVKNFIIDTETLHRPIMENYEDISKEILAYAKDKRSESPNLLVSASIKTRDREGKYKNSEKCIAGIILQKKYSIEVQSIENDPDNSLFYLEIEGIPVKCEDRKLRMSSKQKMKLRLNLSNNYKELMKEIKE